MADFVPFDMGGFNPTNPEVEAQKGQSLICTIMDAIYDQENKSRQPLDVARMRVHACTAFGWRKEDQTFWDAINSAIISTLEQFPIGAEWTKSCTG